MTNLSGVEGGNGGVPFALDSRGLGRIRKVAEAREVWAGEAADFTPWLAENLDVLGEELGLTLNLVATEVSVGDFRLDIYAETPDGRTVIIENQLDRTDHGHLGQILIYASGLEANTVVWVAPTFRDEYRRALDWLNERTNEGVDFVGVEVSVVQIGDGPRAPVFEVIARPNDWQKSVKSGSSGTSKSAGGFEITPLNAQRQEFFAQVLLEVTRTRPSIRMPSKSKSSWMAFAAGPFGNWDVAACLDKRTRVEAYIDTGYHDPNKQLFDELAADADVWEAKCGVPLTWERLDNARACRVAAYHDPVDLDDPPAVAEAQEWAIKTVIGMYDAMNDHLRNRATELRTLAKVSPGA